MDSPGSPCHCLMVRRRQTSLLVKVHLQWPGGACPSVIHLFDFEYQDHHCGFLMLDFQEHYVIVNHTLSHNMQ